MDRDEHLVARGPVLQPRMHRAVPLLQLAQRRPPRTPAAVLGPSALPLPQAGLHHPAPQRVRTHPQGKASLQVFGEQRRPEVPVQRLLRNLQHPFSKLPGQRPVRPPPAQPVNHGRVAVASNFRRNRRKCRRVTPIRAAPAATLSTPSFTCLNTEMRSLSFRRLLSRIQSLTELDPKEDISTSLREDISKSARHEPATEPLTTIHRGIKVHTPQHLVCSPNSGR